MTPGYDAAGRPTTSSVATSGLATADLAVPEVTTTYSTTTGLPTEVSNGSQTMTTGYDTWGRSVSQTDGTGNTAKTTYDAAARVATASDGKGTYTYAYNGTDAAGKKERRGLVTSLDIGLTSGPDVFTGAYDANGALTTQIYPGGLTATYTRDLDGTPYELSYAKTSGGTTTELLAFSQQLDRDGRVRTNDGPETSQTYSYDDRDRLSKVEDTTESGCTTRVYGFSKDSNRESLKTYNPASGGGCQTSTPASNATPSFDDADRITSTGSSGSYAYDALGRTKTVPAADAPTAGLTGQGNLTATFHANEMVATLTQTGTEGGASVTKSQDFTLDAAGRISVIKNLTGGISLAEDTHHYDAGDDKPSWTETKTRPNASTAWTTTWHRNITGLSGDLALIQNSAGGTQLQLANLHGDNVAQTAAASSAIDAYTETTEYGIPRTSGGPARYGWLGTKQRHSNGILGGLTLMGVRLYNPTRGRFLSTDPIEGANDNPFTYPSDPINQSDLSGLRPKPCYCGLGVLVRTSTKRLISMIKRKGVVKVRRGNEIESVRYFLREDKQGKHIVGHANYDAARNRSILSADPYSLMVGVQRGTVVRGSRGQPGSVVEVDYGRTIGTYILQTTGARMATSRARIHYDKGGGVHFVPTIPNPRKRSFQI